MKKFVWLVAAVVATGVTSCDKQGNSYDFAQILYPNSYGAVLYADQTRDTLNFATTYDWSLSCPENWVHISPEYVSGTVPGGYYMVNKAWIDFDANTTDASRVAVVSFHADGKSLETVYEQLNYLHITRPGRGQSGFMQTDEADKRRDSIMFRTYADEWTLAFKGEQPSWLRIEEGSATTGRAGGYKVFYELDPNNTADERSAVLELKSRGVTTEIKISQSGKKEESPK